MGMWNLESQCTIVQTTYDNPLKVNPGAFDRNPEVRNGIEVTFFARQRSFCGSSVRKEREFSGPFSIWRSYSWIPRAANLVMVEVLLHPLRVTGYLVFSVGDGRTFYSHGHNGNACVNILLVGFFYIVSWSDKSYEFRYDENEKVNCLAFFPPDFTRVNFSYEVIVAMYHCP